MVIPPFLTVGDKVAVIAPASRIAYDELLPGLEILKQNWGLEIMEGKSLRKTFHQFAGNDADRLADLQDALSNPEVKAVIMARAGYGFTRIIDRLDFKLFLQKPKWLIGFSDFTVLSSALLVKGVASLHGSMVRQFASEGAQDSVETLRKFIFGEAVSYSLGNVKGLRPGKASGMLTGGNLALVSHLVGSPWDVDTHGKILFLEDVGEYLYNIDRMVIQLKRAGKFERLGALILGQFTELKDSTPGFGRTVEEIFFEHLSRESFPIISNFPAGHVPQNLPVPLGYRAELEVLDNRCILKFPSMYIA